MFTRFAATLVAVSLVAAPALASGTKAEQGTGGAPAATATTTGAKQTVVPAAPQAAVAEVKSDGKAAVTTNAATSTVTAPASGTAVPATPAATPKAEAAKVEQAKPGTDKPVEAPKKQ